MEREVEVDKMERGNKMGNMDECIIWNRENKVQKRGGMHWMEKGKCIKWGG